MEGIRFLHIADLHLDTPFKGMSHLPKVLYQTIQNSTFTAFQQFIHYAVSVSPDFIVIAGDVYDGEHRSLRAQYQFQEGMKQLHASGIPVLMIHGNHDHLSGRWTRFEMPENVIIFGPEVEEHTLEIRGETVRVYGFSYETKHIAEPMIHQYPLANSNDYHIGILHGSLVGDSTHAVYAPFTKEQLLSKGYDYWALGHIHKRQLLHVEPPIVYPGNIQGRHRNEQQAKGFYDVHCTKRATTLQFVETSTIRFETIHVSCNGIVQAGDWFDVCKKAIDELSKSAKGLILSIHFVDITSEADHLFSQATQEEWLDAIREVFSGDTPFIWIQQITFEHALSTEAYETMIKPVVKTMQQWSEADWQHVMSDLYQHPQHMRLLPTLQNEDYESIIQTAITQLQTEVVKRK